MKVSFERRLILFFAILFIGIIILGFVAYKNNRSSNQANKLIAHTKDVIAEAETILSLSKDIVMGSQRYVITGDSAFLGSFPESRTTIYVHINNLRQLTSDNPVQVMRVDTLKTFVDKRINFSDTYVRRRDDQGYEAASNLIASGLGKYYMDRIRSLVGQIEGAENFLLIMRQQESANSVAAFTRAFYALLISVFIFLGVIFFYIRYNLAKRAAVETDLKRAAEELKSSTENFRKLFDLAPYPMWVYDLQTMNFLEVNHATVSVYGYSHEEFLKMTLKDIRPGEELPRLMESIKTRRNTDRMSSSGWRHKLRNGKIIDVEITSQLFNFKGHKAALVIANNITERKRTEEEIKAANQFLDTILENIPNMIFVKDAKELRFVRFNKAGEQLLGYSRKDLIGKNDYDFFPKEQADFFTNKDRDVLEKGELLDISEEPIDTTSGKRILHTKKIPVKDADGKPIYLLGISEDITEQKKAEQKLKDLNERFLRIFNLSPVAMSISYLDTAQLFMVNESFEKLFLLKREEAIGKTFAELKVMTAADRKARIDQVVQQGGNVRGVEVKLRKANGQIVDVLTSIEIIEIENRKCVLSAAMDITDRKEYEDQIIRLNAELNKNLEQLKVLNKELEAFTYSVSHDLRAPLRIIDGYAEIIRNDFKDKLDEEGRQNLDVIRNNARKMGQLIDDLLNLSRLGRKELVQHNVNMDDLVENILLDQQAHFPARKITIEKKPLLPANCDKSMMQQVWTNLVSNAFKYTGKNDNPQVEIGSYKEQDHIIYYIKDNGVGFDMRYADKLFGVFQRLHKMTEFEGTGVGLAIVQRIILKHGGKVWAEAEVDKGATFYFSLPVA